MTFLITMALGRPSLNMPSFAGTSETKPNDPLSAENAFAPQKQPDETAAPVEPKQVVVRLQVEPLGAKVSALGHHLSPGKLALAYETVKEQTQPSQVDDNFFRKTYRVTKNLVIHSIVSACEL